MFQSSILFATFKNVFVWVSLIIRMGYFEFLQRLLHCQIRDTTSDSKMNVTVDIKTTSTKNLNETTNTTNQTAFTVPLENITVLKLWCTYRWFL